METKQTEVNKIYILAGITNIDPNETESFKNLNIETKIVQGKILVTKTTCIDNTGSSNTNHIIRLLTECQNQDAKYYPRIYYPRIMHDLPNDFYDFTPITITTNYKIIKGCGCYTPYETGKLRDSPKTKECFKLKDDYYNLDFYKLTLINNKLIVTEEEINGFNDEAYKNFQPMSFEFF